MSDLYWLTDEQTARLSPYFPKSHGKPRVADRRVLSGIIFVNRNGLRWLGPTNYPLSGEAAARLFVSALHPCLERHSILHQQVYRLERIRLGSKEAQ